MTLSIRAWLVGALLWAGLSPARGQSFNTQSYTNWAGAADADPEWGALTNHLAWCYRQIRERNRILGRPDEETPVPSYICPENDYRVVAEWIDANAGNFVDWTQATNGNFDAYFSRADENEFFPWQLPLFTATNLHAAAGFTNWTHNAQALTSWAAVENKREWLDQIEAAFQAMKWTAGNAGWAEGAVRRVDFWTEGSSNSWAEAAGDAEDAFGAATNSPWACTF